MTTPELSPIARAERFLWHSARLLERLRFEQQFHGAASGPVLTALSGYQNADGGFGQALEPDFRGPVSQPLAVDFALRVLDECGQFDTRLLEPVLAYLLRIRPRDGGVPNVLANAVDYPRAPWWQPDPAQSSSLLPSASLAGMLYKHDVERPWLESASAFCWRALLPASSGAEPRPSSASRHCTPTAGSTSSLCQLPGALRSSSNHRQEKRTTFVRPPFPAATSVILGASRPERRLRAVLYDSTSGVRRCGSSPLQSAWIARVRA